MRADAISRREWVVAIVIALIVTALLQVPYALGYALARPGTEFTGLLINVEDGSYLSAIGQGINGAWLYHLPFTTEEHASAFIQVFYLALGHLAHVLNLSATAMWHLARVVADLVLFIVLYGFSACFLNSPALRRVAYFFAILSAGYDLWRFPFDAANAWEAIPIELRVPEAHVFYSALTYPHFTLGIALVLIAFGLLLCVLNDELTRRQFLVVVGAGIANLLIGIVYPFLIYLLVAVMGAYYLFLICRQRKILWRAAILLFVAFAIPAPLFLYYQFVLTTNPVLQIWNAQATTFSPHPLHFVLTFLPMLVFAALTWRPLVQMEESHKRAFVFLWLWVGVVALLLYVPITQQRRFVEGVQVPLAILAALGLCDVVLPWLARTRVFAALSRRPNYTSPGLQRLIVVGIIALASLSSFYVWLSGVALFGFVQPYPLFRPTAELQAMDWLRVNTIPNEVVLASYWTGSFIPARAGNVVFVGQRYETIRFDEKRQSAEKFFDGATDDAWRAALLREYRIAYVFWGKGERDLGAFDPDRASYLQRVFANEQARVYRVQSP